jgi:hypothetical protein
MDYRQTLFSCQRTNVLSYREAVSFNDFYALLRYNELKF